MSDGRNSSPTETSIQPGSDARRRLLKSLAAGAGAGAAFQALPTSWMRPVVNSVLVPTHAQATCADIVAVPDFAIEIAGVLGASNSVDVTLTTPQLPGVVFQFNAPAITGGEGFNDTLPFDNGPCSGTASINITHITPQTTWQGSIQASFICSDNGNTNECFGTLTFVAAGGNTNGSGEFSTESGGSSSSSVECCVIGEFLLDDLLNGSG